MKELKKNEVFTKDISQVKTTYTNCIERNMLELNVKCENRKITLDELRDYVKSIIKDANETPAKIDFMNKLDNMKSKDNLIMLVYNAYLKGNGLGTKLKRM